MWLRYLTKTKITHEEQNTAENLINKIRNTFRLHNTDHINII